RVVRSAVASFRLVLARSGSSSSSNRMSRYSSRLSANWKLSCPSPSGLPSCPPPSPPPCSGLGRVSPCTNSLLPGSTCSRLPPRAAWWKRGSWMRFFGMLTTSLVSTSPRERSLIERATASLSVSRANRMKRCRLVWLLPFGLSRRSTMFMPVALPEASSRLVHAHVPFDQPPRLPRRVAAADHAGDELGVLLLGLLVALGGEADDRQQVLDM